MGREEPLDVEFMPLGADMFSTGQLDDHRAVASIVESVVELAAAGVTWVAAGVPGESRAEFVDNVVRYGEEVLRSPDFPAGPAGPAGPAEPAGSPEPS